MTPNAPAVRRPTVGVGVVLVALGGVAVALAFTVLQWFGSTGVTGTDDGDGSTFGGIRDVLASVDGVSGSGVEARTVPVQYFGWLGWTLLVLVVLATASATVPNPASPVLRLVAPVLAFAAVAVTFVAIDLVSVSARVAEQTGATPTYDEYLAHAGVGFYTAVAGFALAGIGALVGARRPSS